MRLWGDVPFKTRSSQAGDNLKLGLTDRYQIYTQVINDLKEAADLLPATLPADERVNKWAVKAMLARVALFAGGYSLREDGTLKRPDDYREYYTLAKQQIDDVVGSNLYKLNTSYAQVFKNQCQHILEPTENMFQVAFYNPTTNARANTNNLGYFNAPATALGVYGTSLNRCFTVRPFYNSFDTLDWRRDFAIATYAIDANGYKTQLWSARGDESWTVAKWSKEYQTNSLLERTLTHINTVIMRYADVLLMRAEVENELNNGPNTVAYEAINQIRKRAFGVDQPGSKIEIRIISQGSGYMQLPV
ncbi:RagB/SusD family nutrient uptake outer membrane protein [Niabella hibiscisoli]|uniref:RagB/SusD family nutrient uptake outer membrane protein n=1 Tax=Niabella hibiscisoli TaxID=1825928 RepID=UPI001F117ECC|nr:RagB/SusD family nutrient uptake outer membrane protein [Niabella hibiscisoli]MCH5719317.1 RagB/SusD family nutrient uptake outer membrane protein [Niabella hibiscisoli]